MGEIEKGESEGKKRETREERKRKEKRRGEKRRRRGRGSSRRQRLASPAHLRADWSSRYVRFCAGGWRSFISLGRLSEQVAFLSTVSSANGDCMQVVLGSSCLA